MVIEKNTSQQQDTTVSFDCPGCGRLCAFNVKHAGRRARCTGCSRLFIIPSKSGAKPQKVKSAEEPLPGFYKAALISGWKEFTARRNLAGLVLVITCVFARVFLANLDYSFTVGAFRVQLPLGWVAVFIAWGCQIWYYMETVYYGSLNVKELPELDLGYGFGFLWNLIKSIYLFIIAIIFAEIPFLLIAAVINKIGLTQFAAAVTLAGVFLFPMFIFILSTDRPLYMVFNPIYVITPILKAFRPYSVVAMLMLTSAFLEWYSRSVYQLAGRSAFVIVLHVSGNIIAAAVTIIAMRAAGLFTYYYHCYLPGDDN